jgi:CRISPR-associated protein (TIGR02710 family)
VKPPKSWNLRVGRWHEFLSALADWDRFDHRAAWRRWEQANEAGDAWAEAFATAGLADRLHRLAGGDGHPTPHLLEDLWLNARRSAALGQYDDAVARLYRLTEACVQCRLWNAHRIDTGQVDPRLLTEAERRQMPPLRGRNGRETCKLGLSAALAVLQRLSPDDPVVARWPAGPDERLANPDWQGRRNSSILAHGFSPLGAEDWGAAERWFIELRDPLWEQALGRPTAGQLPETLPR